MLQLLGSRWQKNMKKDRMKRLSKIPKQYGIEFKEYLGAPFFYKGDFITLGDEIFIDNRIRI